MVERTANDIIRIMRIALGRRNENDPDSNDSIMITCLNDFIQLEMSDDLRIVENFSTLSFTIDENTTNGVYTFEEIYGANQEMVSLSNECYISLYDPVDNSVSWNRLPIWRDPGEFYSMWGINNDETLIRGYPTNLLIYGNEFVFRTLPNTTYLVKIYGYKQITDFPTTTDETTGVTELEGNPVVPYAYWTYYLAYGAAMIYARMFRYASDVKAELERDYKHYRTQIMKHSHNFVKMSRAMPRF